MKYIGIILTVVLASCGPRTDLGVNFDIIEVYDQRKAMLNFEGMVEDEFGVRLDNEWENVDVWWVDTECQGRPGLYGIQKGRRCLAGVMFGGSDLYVALSNVDPAKTCGSSLIHEFAHYLSIKVWGHASFCPDEEVTHVGPIWDVVKKAKTAACERGW